MTSGHHSATRDRLIGNVLDRWEMTPNDLKEEMRKHGCGKQLDDLSARLSRMQPTEKAGMKCAICGGIHDNDALTDICTDCEARINTDGSP